MQDEYDLSKMESRKFKPIYECWVCDYRLVNDGLPDGWRATIRGYAGKVYICKLCNELKRTKKRDCPLDES